MHFNTLTPWQQGSGFPICLNPLLTYLAPELTSNEMLKNHQWKTRNDI